MSDSLASGFARPSCPIVPPINAGVSMTRIHLPGLARATKRLADGSKRTYFYAWRGGPLLRGEDGLPLQPGDPAFHAAYAKAHADATRPQSGTIAGLIDEYRRSPEFTERAAATRKDYNRYLDAIESKFGDMPLAAAADPRARGDFKVWRDSMADRPRTADYAWMVLVRILSFARDRGKIAVNVCERGGRLHKGGRADKIWAEADIAAMRAEASPALFLALLMALWTGQREGNLLALPWSAYDGQRITLRQTKTGARVSIPIGKPLRDALDAEKRRSALILTNSLDRPWTPDGFRSSWGKAARRAGIVGLTFHDLRGTAVTRLAIAGCSVPQIAAITGHNLRSVEAILTAHYMGGQRELAEIAIRKLENQ